MIKAFSKLDKHTKVAIFIAPILLILGFAAADMWEEHKASEVRFYQMTPEDFRALPLPCKLSGL